MHREARGEILTVVANRMPDDPLWMFLVAAPSSGKTEVLRALSGAPDVYPLSSLTPQTFASGFEKRDGETSLLPQLSSKTMVMKDFGTVLSRRTRDINLAMQRLGGVDDRCRWVLEDFVVRDPDEVSTGERALVRDNLAALAFGMPQVSVASDRQATWGFDDPVLTDDKALRSLWGRSGSWPTPIARHWSRRLGAPSSVGRRQVRISVFASKGMPTN
jgi:hypothetical protein